MNQNIKPIKILLLLIFCLSVMFNGFAEQDDITVPVEVTIDSYFQLILTSKSVHSSEEGKILTSKDLSPGSLNFGELFPQKHGLKKQKNIFKKSAAGTSHHFINIINNSKPFQVSVSIMPETKDFILALKTAENESCALHVKTLETDKTFKTDNLLNPESWISFPDTGTLILYDSHGEVISDEFEVIFALLDLAPSTPAAKYGGQVIWTLVPTA